MCNTDVPGRYVVLHTCNTFNRIDDQGSTSGTERQHVMHQGFVHCCIAVVRGRGECAIQEEAAAYLLLGVLQLQPHILLLPIHQLAYWQKQPAPDIPPPIVPPASQACAPHTSNDMPVTLMLERCRSCAVLYCMTNADGGAVKAVVGAASA